MRTMSVVHESFRLAEAFTISRGPRTEANVLTVSVRDGEHVGHGECVPYARYDETMASVAAQIAALSEDISRLDLQDVLPAGAAH